MVKRWAGRKQMFCNDNCRSAYWADYRAGLNAGLDKFTDEIAEAHYCIYCRMIVPYNRANVSLDNRGRLVITQIIHENLIEPAICDDCYQNVAMHGHNLEIEH